MRVREAIPVTSTQPARSRSRWWTSTWVLVVVPLAYAVAFNISFRTDENPFNGPDGGVLVALFLLKWATGAALVAGVHRIGGRMAGRPALAPVAAAVWAAVGVALVATVARAKEGGAVLGVDQLWPGNDKAAEMIPHLEVPPGPGWDAGAIVRAELVAVVALTLAVGVALQVLNGRWEQRLATASTVVGFFVGLLVYDRIVGWPVILDFDPFTADAVLGSLTYELMFLIGPVDPLGAIALAAIAVANGVILAVGKGWRGIERPIRAA